MGLIDKDATLKAIADYLRADLADCNHYYLQGAQDVAEVVENMPERGGWIPCSEGLPEEAYPVIVTWKNDDPVSYYQYILGKHYVGVAHYKNGKWYWYSSITEDVLMEYGRCESEEFDEAIRVLAWQPLPEPYKEVIADGQSRAPEGGET